MAVVRICNFRKKILEDIKKASKILGHIVSPMSEMMAADIDHMPAYRSVN